MHAVCPTQLAQKGKKETGTLWDQEKDELAIRILLEEGKLNLALRLLNKYKVVQRSAKFDDLVKVRQHSQRPVCGCSLSAVRVCVVRRRAKSSILMRRLFWHGIDELRSGWGAGWVDLCCAMGVWVRCLVAGVAFSSRVWVCY
jgi:hypothetical protein